MEVEDEVSNVDAKNLKFTRDLRLFGDGAYAYARRWRSVRVVEPMALVPVP